MSHLTALFDAVKKFLRPGPDAKTTRKLSRMAALERFTELLGDDFADVDAAEAEETLGEQGPSFFSQAKPLGEVLGYLKVVIDDENVMETAKRAYRKSPEFKGFKAELGLAPEDKDPTLLTSPWQFIQEPLLSEYQAGAFRQHSLTKEAAFSITPEQCFGKGHLGWVNVPGTTTPLDLCGLNWRMSDWLRPQVVPMTGDAGVPLNSLTMHPVKEGLGDGVDMVVRPDVLGLPDGTIGFHQNRAVVKAPDGTIVRLYKGITVVHPEATNTLAYKDGYGYDVLTQAVHGIGEQGEGAQLHVYDMLNGEKFNPKCRYTLQGLYYQGRPNWERYLLALENIKLAASSSDLLMEDRMLRANVPIKALGGWGLITGLSRLLKLTVVSGKARIALPSDAFLQIRGFEHVHAALAKTYTSKVTGKTIHGFYAPESMRAYFQAAGGIGSEWALNRRPDLPTGACVQRHVLLGFVPFNAFVVNGISMKASGLDFDGDMLCCFPPLERGGLYVCFNDLADEEQARREKASAGLDRKSQEKKDYADGLCRHAGQLACGGILGPADITARKFLDLALPEKAWAMVPWIQASVDMQKRDMALPDPRGAMFMPQVSLLDDEITATQVLRALQKGEPDEDVSEEHRASYDWQWKVFKYKLEQLYLMSKLGSPHFGLRLRAQSDDMAQVIARYGYELGSRMAQAVGELETYRKNGTPLMRQLNYPARQAVSPDVHEHAGLRKLAQTVHLLDTRWDTLMEKAKSDRAMEHAAYAMKDALVELGARKGLLGTLAQHAGTWQVFQMFADEQAYRDYFAQPQFAGCKRLSDLFCLLDERSFARIEDTPGADGSTPMPTYSNTQRMVLGLHEYAPGAVVITRLDRERLLVTAEHAEQPTGNVIYVSKASNIQDALLELRNHAARNLLMFGCMLHPDQLKVERVGTQAEQAPAPAPEATADARQALLSAFGGPEVAPAAPDAPSAALLGEFSAWGGQVKLNTIRQVATDPAAKLLGAFSA